MKFSTKAIHVGQKPDEGTGAVIPPIYMTSTYAQEAPNKHKGYDYTRAGNPNFDNLEATLASLEQANFATIFSSGLGATTAIASTLKAGDKVLATNDLYGGTFRLFSTVFSNFGVEFYTVNTQNLQAVEEALKAKPKFIFLESPTNPLLRISDIEAISELAKKYGTKTVVDNTFASPYFQNPLTLGADVVYHSATKYIGGHSDVVGGVIMTNDEEFAKKVNLARMSIGLNPSPFDAWLTSRGVKTLAVRMKQHASNAMEIAHFLKSHPKVKNIYYPGLPEHPNHDVAMRQMHGFSGIVSVEFDLSQEQAMELISSFKLFTLAESLGGVESLVDHPASMTHASIPKEEREKAGLTDGLVRFSVGIEDVSDLISDIEKALEKF